MVPTYVGVIPWSVANLLEMISGPHVCGGDPIRQCIFALGH